MAVRFFVVDSRFEVGVYKAPQAFTARILNESEGSTVEIFDNFDEAQGAATAIFDRFIHERKRMGLPADDIERLRVDLLEVGEPAVPSYGA